MNVKKIFTTVIVIITLQSCLIYSALKGSTKLLGNLVVTEKVDYKQDFKGGSVSGWDLYPPFQDTGFDPDFYCPRIDVPNGDKYALMFEYHPTLITEHEMGFIKKMMLVASANSKISFYYKADGYGDFKDLKMVLYGMDGKQYSYTASIIDNSKWNYIETSINNFKNSNKSILPETGIGGFSVDTYIPKTNMDIKYRLYVGGLSITALQPVKFEIKNPSSVYLQNINLIIPLHHYKAGEVFSLTSELPVGIKLNSVEVNLKNSEGKVILNNIPLNYSSFKNSWINNNLYKFKNEDEPGQWSVKIEGKDRSGKIINTKFKIWIDRNNLSHPRLFFTSDGINKLKERIKTEHWKVWWASLVKSAARIRNTSNVGSILFGAETSSLHKVPPTKFSLESLSKVNIAAEFDTVFLLPELQRYFDIMEPAQNILEENAIIYAITGDTAAGNFAKDALLIISKWNTWNHPWFTARHRLTYYTVGEMGVRAAICYDIVYPLLTQEERDIVCEGFLKNCIKPAYDEYVYQDRVPTATSNWVSNTVSGGICAALVTLGDDPKMNDYEPYLSGLIGKLELNIHCTLDTVGAWGEGIGYEGFAYSNTLPTLGAIKNVLNLNLASKGILNSYKYFLYNYSNPHVLDVGDSEPSLMTLDEFAWLSANSNNPVYQWFYMKSPRVSIYDFLFGSDEGKPTPPNKLAESIEFPELGAVVFRSGWYPDDIVLNFRSGPFYNHQHFDQGNIQINAFGESLLTEGGRADYYANPRYRSYYIQPIAHNTLLLDGDAHSQRSGDFLHFIKAADKRARLTDFITTNGFSSATGEIADVYKGKLKEFERNIIFMNKKYFVVYDKIKASKDPHQYDLLFHFANMQELKLDKGNIFTYSTSKASLYSQIVFPENINLKLVNGPVEFGTPILQTGYVKASNPEKSIGENVLTILYPQKGNENVLSVSNDISKLKGNNYIGIKVNNEGKTDELLFRTDGKRINSEKISTDGEIAEVTLDNNIPSNFAAQGISSFCYNGNHLIETARPITFAEDIKNNSSTWEFSSREDCKTQIYLASSPKRILENGKELENNEYQIINNKLIITISAGNNSLEIEY